jgi:uncharacterized integral membrane protein
MPSLQEVNRMTFWVCLIDTMVKSTAYLLVGCCFSIILLMYAIFQDEGRYEYLMEAAPYPAYIGALAALTFIVIGLVIYLLKSVRVIR